MPGIDIEEAVAEALLQLVEVSRRWRPDLAPFKSFARPRIEGAVVDYARTCDIMGRQERAALKAGRETKLARRGLPRRVRGDIADLERSRTIPTGRPPGQMDAVHRAELLAAVRALPPRLATVLERYAFDDETMREISDTLGISEVRVCQLLKEARQHLHAALATPHTTR